MTSLKLPGEIFLESSKYEDKIYFVKGQVVKSIQVKKSKGLNISQFTSFLGSKKNE